MNDNINKSTKTKILLDLANSDPKNIVLLEKILLILQDRKNEFAFSALLEIGNMLQVVKSETVAIKREETNGYFKWPSTSAPASKHGFECEAYFYKDGLLSFVGYRVGEQGEVTSVRRKILDCVFHNNLPKVDSEEYMNEWAEVRTPYRLKKIADCISSFVRLAKRRSDVDLSIAIDEWEGDLKYLHEKYYVGVFKFDWPK